MNKAKTFDSSLIKKGIFALVVVAIAGATGAVFAAPNTNQGNGYGNQQAAIDAVNKLNEGYNTASTNFVNKVSTAVDTASAKLGESKDTDKFAAAFNTSSNKYYQSVADARAKFLAAVQQAANTAESKDQFIDKFNNLKANYFNELDAAKNELANSLSPMGDSANQIKDAFMNSYNSARDMYGNELEVIKNDFANTISNL